MNSPLEKLVREVIKMPLGLKFALCEYEHCPFFHCGSASRASMKQNTSSVVGFIVVALYTQVVPVITAAARKISKLSNKHLARNLSSRTIYFPVASNHVKALGLR